MVFFDLQPLYSKFREISGNIPLLRTLNLPLSNLKWRVGEMIYQRGNILFILLLRYLGFCFLKSARFHWLEIFQRGE